MFADRLANLPAKPGVYVFRGHDGTVLYVGKATSLRSRVRSYFARGTSDVRAFVDRLHSECGDIETYVVENEREAVLLEAELVKSLRPVYNVKLRDDKDYLSIRLDPDEPWPRLRVVRRPDADGAQYFGPYPSATSARSALRTVNRHFRLRTCTDSEMRSRRRPCLQYQIDRCPAPCVLDVAADEYAAQVQGASLFLQGRHGSLIDSLRSRMQQASEDMAYEHAAQIRDQLRAVQAVHESQRVASVTEGSVDALAIARNENTGVLTVVQVRDGRVASIRSYPFEPTPLPDDEVLSGFVLRYYPATSFIPDELVVSVLPEGHEAIADVLGGDLKKRVRFRAPQRGRLAHLLALAEENATHALQEAESRFDDVEAKLVVLKDRLRLPNVPQRIECVDVSHLGGEDTSAVFVSMYRGEPEPSRYRSFRVRGVTPGDDYGAMHQVFSRRLHRAQRASEEDRASEKDQAWSLPDLFVVDGGRGQLAVAEQAARELGVEVPIVGLAKEKERPGAERVYDRIVLPGTKNAIEVRDAAAFRILTHARDEAHRVSNRLRGIVGRKQRFKSELDGVPGVGPKTKRKLLQAFPSVEAIAVADDAALRAAGANQRQIEALRRALGSRASAPQSPHDRSGRDAQENLEDAKKT